MNYLGFVILFSCCALGSTQALNNTTSLSCYVCNPLNDSATCADPARNNVSLVNCSTDTTTGNIASCRSSYLNFNNVTNRSNETGIYRDCVTVIPQTNVCNESRGINVTTVTCEHCTVSGCNNHTFNSEGGIITGGGTGGGKRPGGASISILLLSVFFMYCKSFL